MLHAGALNADAELVREALEAGADPDCADSNGLTALHLAGFAGGEDGADPVVVVVAVAVVVVAIGLTLTRLPPTVGLRGSPFIRQ